MAIKKSVCSKLIKNFELRDLFNQLGWNHTTKKEKVAVDHQSYQLEAIAEKSAFYIFLCETPVKIVDYATRKKIDSAITKLYNQHLIIFTDSSEKQQIWQLVVKTLDRPAVVRETHYFSHQEPELLFQKLQHLFFSIDEEDNISIIDVTGRVRGGFNANAEKVTKKFYEGFKKEHTAFLSHIKNIDADTDKEWYASLMLNRLMFIYFIQKKGFLDNNKDYLQTKLRESQSKKGKDKFYSFYRNFLLILFHEGLGQPDNKKLEKELGRIPYLNGGLFEVHELEQTYSDIQIADKAFQRIFDFFDDYEWHLDTRQQATGKEINPDVIGYIFEKYINDRAAMGAYYTKEDITEYIAKNCIIPFLFNELNRNYPESLYNKGEIWALLSNNPDDYIYPALQHGAKLELPEEIAKGINNVVNRMDWNKPASEEYALPTEIWREVVARRNRYEDVKDKIEKGEISEISDLITYNLNITKFAIDVLQNTTDPKLIEHFYSAMEKITVLDPTCGSGAFLFAALNILESLYESCITRMRAFVLESASDCCIAFGDILKRIDSPEHPNLQYFIFKAIILNNLYGVDIMKEAVEIAKLRLFLKLVASVDVDYKKPNLGLEPLPDIDFNIRSGNTLIGFSSLNDVERMVEGSFNKQFLSREIEDIKKQAEVVKKAYEKFKHTQIYSNSSRMRDCKQDLDLRLQKLTDKLDRYQAQLCGIEAERNPAAFNVWKNTHQPLHWFAEFYEIINDKGGFDIVIGNPPYVEYSKVKETYRIQNYQTETCSNLYAFVLERVGTIRSCNGFYGLIVPLSAFCTQRMLPLVDLIKRQNNDNWLSHFGWRPSTLFEGVNIPLSILISDNAIRDQSNFYTTEFIKWYRLKRNYLFDNISFVNSNSLLKLNFVIPKIGPKMKAVIGKLLKSKDILSSFVSLHQTKHILYYRNTGGLYWRIITDFKPYFSVNGKDASSSTLCELSFKHDDYLRLATAVLNSNLFWLYYVSYSSFHHVNPIDIVGFPIDLDNIHKSTRSELIKLSHELMADLKNKSVIAQRIHKGGKTSKSQTFYPSQSKSIVDEIDKVLAKHYGFSDGELDFIINYDIEYRTSTNKDLDVEDCSD
jgi:hypothetical protein